MSTDQAVTSFEPLHVKSFRTKRTKLIIKLLKSSPPLMAEQVDAIKRAADEVPRHEQASSNDERDD